MFNQLDPAVIRHCVFIAQQETLTVIDHRTARQIAHAYTWSWVTCWFAGEGEITFLYHSLTSSPAAYRYDVGAGRLEQLTRPLLQHPNLTTRLAWASSEDGTRIPVETLAMP